MVSVPSEGSAHRKKPPTHVPSSVRIRFILRLSSFGPTNFFNFRSLKCQTLPLRTAASGNRIASHHPSPVLPLLRHVQPLLVIGDDVDADLSGHLVEDVLLNSQCRLALLVSRSIGDVVLVSLSTSLLLSCLSNLAALCASPDFVAFAECGYDSSQLTGNLNLNWRGALN